MKKVIYKTKEFKRIRYDLVVDGLLLGCVVLHVPRKNESKVDDFVSILCANPLLHELLDVKRVKELDDNLPF